MDGVHWSLIIGGGVSLPSPRSLHGGDPLPSTNSSSAALSNALESVPRQRGFTPTRPRALNLDRDFHSNPALGASERPNSLAYLQLSPRGRREEDGERVYYSLPSHSLPQPAKPTKKLPLPPLPRAHLPNLNLNLDPAPTIASVLALPDLPARQPKQLQPLERDELLKKLQGIQLPPLPSPSSPKVLFPEDDDCAVRIQCVDSPVPPLKIRHFTQVSPAFVYSNESALASPSHLMIVSTGPTSAANHLPRMPLFSFHSKV